MTDQTKHEPPPDHRELADIKARLERLLFENIVPAWYPDSIDRLWGGYRLDRDVSGRWLPRADKMIVSQARMVWFFSRLARFVPDGSDYLNAARRGIRFLNRRMKDQTHGGFIIQVSPSGWRKTNKSKHVYCQTMVLMALSEYARASADEHVLSQADELFWTIENRCHDAALPGYRETFLRNWDLLPKGALRFMNAPPGAKTLNTHMHVIEAFTSYMAVRQDKRCTERILELLDVFRSIATHTKTGAFGDVFKADWSPHPDAKFNRVSYGHNIELVWLFIDACEIAKQSPNSDIPWFETVFDFALRNGFDDEKGGFFESGPLDGKADKLDKVFWVQAEALVSALIMYRMTKNPKYWTCFVKTLTWIETSQADWEGGDWHCKITAEGTPYEPKAGPWKAAYHNGRAMMECLERLPVPSSK